MLDVGKFCATQEFPKYVFMTSSRWIHMLLIQEVVNIFSVICEIRKQVKMFIFSFGVPDTVSQLFLAKVRVQS